MQVASPNYKANVPISWTIVIVQLKVALSRLEVSGPLVNKVSPNADVMEIVRGLVFNSFLSLFPRSHKRFASIFFSRCHSWLVPAKPESVFPNLEYISSWKYISKLIAIKTDKLLLVVEHFCVLTPFGIFGYLKKDNSSIIHILFAWIILHDHPFSGVIRSNGPTRLGFEIWKGQKGSIIFGWQLDEFGGYIQTQECGLQFIFHQELATKHHVEKRM